MAAESDGTELVERLQARDEAAFEELVREHGGRMLAVTRRLLGDTDDARDAVQDALLSVHRSIDRFQGGSQLGTWLHRIAVNAALMKLRSEGRRPEETLGDLLPEYDEAGHRLGEVRGWEPPSDSALESAELRALVRESIDSLPEGHRSVLVLRDLEQLDTAETAELLGIKPGAVKTRLHRARQALRTLLEERLGDTQP